ncbi:MAG: flavin reductase family protein [Planctomycetota bacterium]
MTGNGVDSEALFTLSYGVYVVTSHRGESLNGQISNTVMQVTDTPPRLAAAINTRSLTHEFISNSGVFAVTVLAESAPMKLIGLFGFRSGRDIDKLSQVSYETGSTGCPVIHEHALASMELQVESKLACGTHTVFVGQVVAAGIIGQGRPMTYAYYREVLGGKTPPTAPTYRASGTVRPRK